MNAAGLLGVYRLDRRDDMISLRENNDSRILCPHCSESLQEVWYRELKALLGKRYVYFCSNCRKVLGVSHRKGFFMG